MKRTIVQILFAMLAALRLTAATPVWDSGLYTYDAAGNIVHIGNDAYTYDGAGRLVTATAHTPGHSNAQSFVYDRHGNIDRITTNGVVTSLQPNARTNRLPGVAYDDAGNQLGVAGTGVTYAYDSHGMMTTRGDVTLTELYVYDANDERIVSVRGAGNRLYTLRGLDQKVVREVEHDPAAAKWTWTRDYVYRGGTLLASYAAGGPATLPHRHYHVDHLGTPRVITSAEGHRLKLHTYWPFGTEAPGSEPDDERMKFTGHERDNVGDPARELDYMHARYYAPGGSRFLSVDRVPGEMSRPQSWNRYVYSSNNPVNRLDPDGNKDTWAQRAANKVEGWGSSLREAGARLNDGSVLGIAMETAVASFGDVVGDSGDMLNVGTATGEALGNNADGHDLGMAMSQDVVRGSALFVTLGAPAAPISRATSTTRLYRTVDDVELADINATNSFRPSPNGTEYKGFFNQRADAQDLGEKLSQSTGDTYTVVEATAPRPVVKKAPKHSAAGEGEGVLIPNEDLSKVKPRK